MGGEPGQQSVGRVQRGGVGGRVDDGDDGVEAGARDVVGVALAGAVGRVVVCGEDQAGAYRVTGVVHREDGRAGGGRVAHDDVDGVLQLPGQAQRRVHQLLEAEDEYASGAGGQRPGDPAGHAGQGRLEPVPLRRRESVPSAVRYAHGPAQVDAGDGPGRVRGRRSGGGSAAGASAAPGFRRPALRRPARRPAPRGGRPAPAPSPGRRPAAGRCPRRPSPGRCGRRSPGRSFPAGPRRRASACRPGRRRHTARGGSARAGRGRC